MTLRQIDAPPQTFTRGGKIVRSAEPLNLEMPFEKLEHFITPTELFYVRTHSAIPKIDRDRWRLRVEGEVEQPFELSYDALTNLASKTIVAMLECAGNTPAPSNPKCRACNGDWAPSVLPIGREFLCPSCSKQPLNESYPLQHPPV